MVEAVEATQVAMTDRIAVAVTGVAVEDIQIRAMATAAVPQAIKTELEAATTAQAVVAALLSAAKKTLSSSED